MILIYLAYHTIDILNTVLLKIVYNGRFKSEIHVIVEERKTKMSRVIETDNY